MPTLSHDNLSSHSTTPTMIILVSNMSSKTTFIVATTTLASVISMSANNINQANKGRGSLGLADSKIHAKHKHHHDTEWQPRLHQSTPAII